MRGINDENKLLKQQTKLASERTLTNSPVPFISVSVSTQTSTESSFEASHSPIPDSKYIERMQSSSALNLQSDSTSFCQPLPPVPQLTATMLLPDN